MKARFLFFLFLILIISSCDKYYEAKCIIENKTNKHITINYQIDFNTNYDPDSVYQIIIAPQAKREIYNDPNSHGMKCEDIRSNQERIYFLNILGVIDSDNDSCHKAYNDCSEWNYYTKERELKLDLITYKLVLYEDDFKHPVTINKHN